MPQNLPSVRDAGPSQLPAERITPGPVRVGVIPLALQGRALDVFRLLLLRVNTLQSVLEFCFLPVVKHPFLDGLRSTDSLKREKFMEGGPGFVAEYSAAMAREATRFGVRDPSARGYVILSTARFHDFYFSDGVPRLQVIALGYWERHMAPPSILEFFLFLTVRYAVGFAHPDFTSGRHYGNTGCLWDFSPDLEEARDRILTGYVCPECRASLVDAGLGELCDALPKVFRAEWLGEPSDPTSLAGLGRKLGHDLFITTGLKPTRWESLKATLSNEGPKEALKVAGGIVLVAILVWFGLQMP